MASQFGISVGVVNNILKRKREYPTVLICVHCISGTCVHEHISPLLGEHRCIVNICLGPAIVQYREVSLYMVCFSSILLNKNYIYLLTAKSFNCRANPSTDDGFSSLSLVFKNAGI